MEINYNTNIIPLVKFWWVSHVNLMNLIASHEKLSNTSGRFLRWLNSIVDTVPSACVLLRPGWLWSMGTVNENMKYKRLKLSISLNIPFGFANFYKFISELYLIACHFKGEIDISIRLHSRSWTIFFFPDGFVVLFLNVILLKYCFVY